MNHIEQKQMKVVVIGGGTGTFVVLKGLKLFPLSLSVIVAMSDSGGSNKRIRDEFGLLPTSDIRQCLVALSDERREAGLMRKLFMYRFEKGRGISGMTFGNLFMAALSDILGSQQNAIEQTGRVLRIKGKIIPVSYTDTNLFAEYEDGTVVSEEHMIDEPVHDGTLKITKLYLKPKATANPEAINAIKQADMIILGPGDLYTSVLANITINEIKDALTKTKAKKVYVLNLMTKYGQTYNYKALDHVRSVESIMGTSLDYVLVNKAPLPKKALAVYKKWMEVPVADDLDGQTNGKIIRRDLLSNEMIKKSGSDELVRSLIRHDSDKLAKVLYEIVSGEV